MKVFDTPWLVCPYPQRHAKVRLFCFPYAGAGSSSYYKWYNFFPDDIEVCGIQLPGRQYRFKEKPFTELLSLVKALACVLQPFLDSPFAFFGHSMGAKISFELARELRRQGMREPSYLFVSGSRAPHMPDREGPIHDLPDDQFIEHLRDYQGTPKNVLNNRELMEIFMPVLRADMKLDRTYICREMASLNCPIIALGGDNDKYATYEEVLAWRLHTKGQFTVQFLEGGHFFINTCNSQDHVLHLILRTLL